MAVGLAPCPFAQVHGPPDAEELHGSDPRGVLYTAGLVEVEHDTRGHEFGQGTREDHKAPRAHERRRDVLLVLQHLAVLHPRSQVGRELKVESRKSKEVLAGVVGDGSLMQKSVHAVCHLQRDGGTHGVFLMQGGFGIKSLVVLRAPGDRPYLRFGCEVISRLLIEDGDG